MENTPEKAVVTPLNVHETAINLEQIIGVGEEGSIFNEMAAILNLDEDQFALLAPGVIQAYQQSINNPADKIALTQAINASGMKAEDLTGSFSGICEEIEKMNISTQKRDFLKNIIATLVNAVNDTEGIAKRLVVVPLEICNPEAKVPQYAHTSDSGVDVYALDDITIKPGETVLVPTGLKVALPVGYELQVRPKSGRALKTHLRVANAPGTIDQGYRDEIGIIIENNEAPIKDITVDEEGKVTSILYGQNYTIGKGEKFCQLVLAEVPKIAFYGVEKVLDVDSEDRGGGFGSTGLK